MQKNELDNYISKNIKEINRIIKVHNKDNFYNNEVLLSNLYLYLYNRYEDLNETSVKYSIIHFCNVQKHWRKNKSYFITEKMHKADYILGVNNCVSESYSSSFESILEDKHDEFIDTLKLNYINKKKLNKKNQLLFNDYFNNNFKNYNDIMSFYLVKKTNAFKIQKKMREMENDFYTFCKKELELL